MKLISLEANQPSFRTVRFNPEGISLIVGQKADPTETGGRKTFNGVGKSLSVYLTHFCLGSAPKPILKQFLPGWIFKLRFSHHGSEHVVERSTEEQTKLIYNGVPVHLEEFTKHLGSEVFGLAADTRFLSFRTLIKRFARPGKHAYLAFDQFDKSEKDFQKLLANGRLFGLSTELVQKKYDLREFETRTESLRKSLESDPIFKGYFIRDSDGRIERTELQSQMARLEARLDTFQVAEDYSEIKTEVATLKQNLAEVTAELGSIRARLSAIAKALDLGRDISRAELVQVFEQSNLLLSQGAKRSLEELEDFHRTLLEDRRSRFEDERNRLREREKGLEERRSSFADRHRELLQYLDSHGALEEYQTLSKQLAALRARFEKLLSYQEILQNYRNEVLRARHEQIEQNEAAERYLTEAELLINRNLQVFRDFSSRFYENRAGGVTVKNNDGNNQLRFEIQCHLADDASSGINEVKIFCYDAMILSSRHNHEVEFLFHDSILYSNMDPRQRSILFESADQLCRESSLQYLATINQDALESIKTELGHDRYAQLVEPCIVLRLTDKSDAEKLLGISVDLEYDK